MIRFTKRFYAGFPLTLGGILTAFNYMNSYRPLTIVFFWAGILAGIFGMYLMWKGIKAKKIKVGDTR